MTSDLDLLRQFAQENSQDAFGEIVRRHLNLVYSAALRQVRSPQLAEDIAQSVFADLASVAATPPSPLHGRDILLPDNLTPWLYAVTRRTAIDAIRKESRRQLREQIAVEMNNMNADANDWTQIAPLLDDAMAALDETDRSAVLLRYFENKSLREVGEALGASDDAAQKRVSRAVERLRDFFSKRNVTIGASGLAVLISANAVQSAPVGLAAAISAAALAGTTATTSTIIAATKSIAMTTLQKTIIGAALAATVGTGVFEARQVSQLRDQVQTLQQQQTSLDGQIQELGRERDDATNHVAGLLAENKRLSSNSNEMELLKLRGEATRLRSYSQALANLKADPTGAAGRVAKIKARLEQMPEKKIPELRFLTDQEWQQVAGRPNKLETDEDYRQAFSNLRQRAKDLFVRWLGQALHNYAKANGGYLPTDLSQLKPYFTPPVADANWKPGDPKRYELLPVEDAILQRYQLVQSGKLSEVPLVGTYPPVVVTGNADLDARTAAQRKKTKTNLPWTEPVVVEKAPVDDQFDTLFTVTVYGWSNRKFQSGRDIGSGSGTFAKAQVGTNGVPELVDPPCGRRETLGRRGIVQQRLRQWRRRFLRRRWLRRLKRILQWCWGNAIVGTIGNSAQGYQQLPPSSRCRGGNAPRRNGFSPRGAGGVLHWFLIVDRVGASGYLGFVQHELKDEISLAIARRVAERLSRRPELIQIARENLDRWSKRNAGAPGLLRCYAEWRDILKCPLEEICRLLESDTGEARRLRQNSPFAGVLSAREVWELKRNHRHETSAA